MKIAYIYPEEIPSNKARTISVINSSYELSKITDCTLFVDSKSNLDNVYTRYNLKHSHLKFEKISKKIFGITSNKFFNKNLTSKLKKDSFDIIYTRHLKTAQYLIKNRLKNQKIIFESHEIFYKTFQEDQPNSSSKIDKLRTLEEYIYKNCDGIVYVNKTLQEHLNLTFSDIQPKQIIIYNGMNFDDILIEKSFSFVNELYYIGNFFKWKGIEDAINAMVHLNNISLKIVGGDSIKRTLELKKLVSDLKLDDNIDFIGFLPTKEVKEILQKKSKITIIPNTKSIQNIFSMPIKLYEYLATSNIVIAANMPTIKEIIRDGENGFLFESGNISSFVECVKKVLSMPPSELQKISSQAYKDSQEFTWENRAKKIYEFAKTIK